MKFLLPILFPLLFTSCNGQKNKPVEIKESKVYTNADIITSSLLDKNGDLWFGTSTEGLYKYDGEKFSNFNESNGLCTNQIWSIIEDDKGIIWLATNKGLCKYNSNTFTQISLPYIDTSSDWYKDIYPTINPNQANSIIQDKDGIFWISTSGGGAYKYDGNTFENILADKGRKYEDSLHHNVIQSVMEDKNGNIWFASMSNGGITRFDGETFKDLKSEDGLSDNMVRNLFQDNEGNIWIGTNGNRNGGLDKFDGKNFTNFNESNGLCSNNIDVIYQTKSGVMWFGSDRSGVCYLENGKFIPIQELSEVAIRTIIEDKNGDLWFGGRKGNLWKYEGKQLTDLTQLKNE
ncbi:two-component regulator propeller domain-containing protein [Pontimicrobium sp. SW4]|uniref:Two-component regulator propeller domain-containing protein n=1 Tax=Pontimicrobium sp. SW4 TaxID=3153519 RepID=A0AAU7BWK0_9FLAO